MPREPSPGRSTAPELSSAVTSALRGGLRPRGAGDACPAEREVRVALRAVCDDARRRGLRAEQVIVSLKEAWAAIPEVSVLPPGSRRQEVLSCLVTLCIDEYYAARDD
jgi:hypothetical protein